MPPLPSIPEIHYSSPGQEDFAGLAEEFKLGGVAMSLSYQQEQPICLFMPPGIDPNAAIVYAFMGNVFDTSKAVVDDYFGDYEAYLEKGPAVLRQRQEEGRSIDLPGLELALTSRRKGWLGFLLRNKDEQ